MSEEVASENTNPALTPEEKVQHVKNNLHNQLITIHNQLFHFINSTPMADDNKRFALMNLSQVRFWANEGIQLMEFEVVPPAKEGESKDAVEEGNKQEGNPEEHQDGNKVGEEAEPSSSNCL